MGTFPTAGASLLPLAISRFRQEHAGVELSVRSTRRGALLQMLVNREITDVAPVGLPVGATRPSRTST